MWSQFRRLAAAIGLTAEEIEAVERGGQATLVPVPINPLIQIRARPDPDWTQRMHEAFKGTLANTRREPAGTIPIADGQLVIADANAPEAAVTAHVTAGEYEVVLTVAYEGDEQTDEYERTDDYEEYVSHAFALLRDNKGVTAIEPLTDENGVELWVGGDIVAFAGAGVMPRIAAEQPGLSTWRARWTIPDLLRIVDPEANLVDAQSVRFPTRDGTGVLIACNAGYRPGFGREDYSLFRLADAEGATVGVLVDFWVDNRPWDDDLSDQKAGIHDGTPGFMQPVNHHRGPRACLRLIQELDFLREAPLRACSYRGILAPTEGSRRQHPGAGSVPDYQPRDGRDEILRSRTSG